jgi:hypothetical protein
MLSKLRMQLMRILNPKAISPARGDFIFFQTVRAVPARCLFC